MKKNIQTFNLNRSVTSTQELDNHTLEFLNYITNLITVKGVEYRRNDDPLHNFNRGVNRNNILTTREEVIRGMRVKHDISVDDMITDINSGITYTPEKLREKYGDIVIYNILEYLSLIDKSNFNKNIEDNG